MRSVWTSTGITMDDRQVAAADRAGSAMEPVAHRIRFPSRSSHAMSQPYLTPEPTGEAPREASRSASRDGTPLSAGLPSRLPAADAPHPGATSGRGWLASLRAGARRTSVAVALLLSLVVALMALVQYAFYDPTVAPRSPVNFVHHPTAIVFHAVGAAFAPFIGLLQCSTRFRRRWPAWHRWLGRLYLVGCVLIGGAAGVWLSFFAYGGITVRVGLLLIGLLWFYSSWRAYVAIRNGQVAAHRRWMLRSVAMAFGGVTLRTYLLLLVLSSVPFLTAYRIVAWASWVPNLLIVEYLLRREARRRGGLRTDAWQPMTHSPITQ